LNALAVASVLALASAPVVVLDPGFILSFGATIAIVVGVPRLLPARKHVREGLARAAGAAAMVALGLLAATICADLALTPAAAVMFSRVTFAGLLLNFAAVPLMVVVQAGALAVLALADASPHAASSCGYVVHLAATGLVDSARIVDVLPWLAREVSPPAWWLVSAYYCAVIVGVASRRFRVPAVAVALGSGIAIVAGLPLTSSHAVPAPASGTLRVVVLDVGQGDATLVVLPGGRSIVVDAGGLPGAAFDVGERVVVPALRALQVRRVDTLVITHGDPDHIGGAAALLSSTRPHAIWEGIPVPPHEGLRALADAAGRTGTSWRYVQAGDVERTGPVEITVLHPPPPDWERQRVRNEDSVVLEIRLGDVAIVLPGDIGREGERAILPRLSRAKTVILKAPHHGSASSSTTELLDVLQPEAVIFSAGRGNRFGHPHPVVVERYRSRGVHLFGTHEDGAVIVETDGAKTEIRGWHSGRRVTFGESSLPR
jgi:competence protein ComEC